MARCNKATPAQVMLLQLSGWTAHFSQAFLVFEDHQEGSSPDFSARVKKRLKAGAGSSPLYRPVHRSRVVNCVIHLSKPRARTHTQG